LAGRPLTCHQSTTLMTRRCQGLPMAARIDADGDEVQSSGQGFP
jgi:hypothetical protein